MKQEDCLWPATFHHIETVHIKPAFYHWIFELSYTDEHLEHNIVLCCVRETKRSTNLWQVTLWYNEVLLTKPAWYWRAIRCCRPILREWHQDIDKWQVTFHPNEALHTISEPARTDVQSESASSVTWLFYWLLKWKEQSIGYLFGVERDLTMFPCSSHPPF